jgi:hypothetical protein
MDAWGRSEELAERLYVWGVCNRLLRIPVVLILLCGGCRAGSFPSTQPCLENALSAVAAGAGLGAWGWTRPRKWHVPVHDEVLRTWEQISKWPFRAQCMHEPRPSAVALQMVSPGSRAPVISRTMQPPAGPGLYCVRRAGSKVQNGPARAGRLEEEKPNLPLPENEAIHRFHTAPGDVNRRPTRASNNRPPFKIALP